MASTGVDNRLITRQVVAGLRELDRLLLLNLLPTASVAPRHPHRDTSRCLKTLVPRHLF